MQVSASALPIRAPPRCPSCARSTRCPACEPCWGCSRASAPAPPTATRAWRASLAVTLLHLGPGLANGLAYLHDARRARSPIVNLVGDHATWHLAADAPLTSDIESLARPVSAGSGATSLPPRSALMRRRRLPRHGSRPDRSPRSSFRTIASSNGRLVRPAYPTFPRGRALRTRRLLVPPRGCALEAPAVLFLGGDGLSERGVRAAARIAEATRCTLMCETFPARWERGAGTPSIERLPYFPDQAIAALARFHSVVLAGAKPPVAFFGYPGLPSHLLSSEHRHATLATPYDDITERSRLSPMGSVLRAMPTCRSDKR